MRFRRRLVPALAALCLVAAGCSEEETTKVEEEEAAEEETATESVVPPETAGKPRPKPRVAKPKGAAPKRLVKQDLIKGKGSVVKTGDQIQVNYVGVLHKNGEEFDSSFDSGQPFGFQLGGSEVIPGWDRGVVGMRVGGRRRLVIPPDLAYGASGSPPAIGPNETLLFVIDLLSKQ